MKSLKKLTNQLKVSIEEQSKIGYCCKHIYEDISTYGTCYDCDKPLKPVRFTFPMGDKKLAAAIAWANEAGIADRHRIHDWLIRNEMAALGYQVAAGLYGEAGHWYD